MDQKFFIVPFAASGDKTAIPDDVQPSGSISYASGWGFDYQRTLGVDPAAKPVSRQSTNQFGYDLSLALGALQRRAFPEWITTADNDGAPFPYDAGVIVNYDTGSAFVPYVSLVASNTAEPSTDATKWQAVIFQEASQAQAEAGTNATTLMTPRRVAQAIAALGAAVPAATTVIAGITRYATAAEATAQAVTTAAVTPSALTGYARLSTANAFSGNISAPQVTATANTFVGGAANAVLATSAASGQVLLRPNGPASGVGQFVVDSAGNASAAAAFNATQLTSSNNVTANTNFLSSNAFWVGATAGPGSFLFRPNGVASTVGQLELNSGGTLTSAGQMIAAGGFQNGSSRYLKDLDGPITDASEIIRRITPQWGRYKTTYNADPRRRAFFVAEDMRGTGAEPMVFEGSIDEFPGAENPEDRGRKLPGVDYGMAAPILWAALSEQITKNEALEARLDALVVLLARNGISE